MTNSIKNFQLRYMGDDVLLKPTVMVDMSDDIVKQIVRTDVEKMINLMYFMRAIGLAANQVGLPHRLFIMDVKVQFDKKGRPIKKNPIVLINPQIEERIGKQVGPEGCLSIPNQQLNIERDETITVKYLDLDGEERMGICVGLEARCVQHEIDHLDGKLMTDHIPASEKTIVMARHLKNIRR